MIHFHMLNYVLEEIFRGWQVSVCFNELKSTVAAIRIKDGNNRGEDTIAILRFENNKLSLVESVNCGGRSPRDFNFVGDYLLCTNQDSDSVTLLDTKDHYRICAKLAVKMPICACIQ